MVAGGRRFQFFIVRMKRKPYAHKSALVHAAHNLIFSVCCLAGSTSIFESESALALAIQQHNTPKLFRWRVDAFSFQGIADGIASSYIERHGLPSWVELDAGLEHASCRKLKSYWNFADCDYREGAGTCNEPTIFGRARYLGTSSATAA
jgi:hypothetical protein